MLFKNHRGAEGGSDTDFSSSPLSTSIAWQTANLTYCQVPGIHLGASAKK
jgi:hypothetical protein